MIPTKTTMLYNKWHKYYYFLGRKQLNQTKKKRHQSDDHFRPANVTDLKIYTECKMPSTNYLSIPYIVKYNWAAYLTLTTLTFLNEYHSNTYS